MPIINTMKPRLSFVVLLFFTIMSFFAQVEARQANFERHSPPDVLKDFELLRLRLQQNPRDVGALNSMGIIYANSGRLHEAIRLWQHALRINSRHVHLYNNLGSALKQLGRYDQARVIFQTGLGISADHLIYYNLGLLERASGNNSASITYFRHCLGVNPAFQPAIIQLGEMGYHVQLPEMNHRQPISLGSYKPPVDAVDTGSSQTQPGYQQSDRPARPAPPPFKPLSLQNCIEMIASFEVEAKEKYIALTFDDGPHHTNTIEILDLLKEYGIEATFFVLGSRAQTYPEIISRMAKEGHDVGNHTWDHSSLTKMSDSEAIENLQKSANFINSHTLKPVNLVRPPYGQTNDRVSKMIHSQGWHEIMWDSDSRDWENRNPDRILHRVMHSIRPGGIVLFHDIHPGAAKMLPTLIEAFKANGYRFVTINEMIKLAASS